MSYDRAKDPVESRQSIFNNLRSVLQAGFGDKETPTRARLDALCDSVLNDEGYAAHLTTEDYQRLLIEEHRIALAYGRVALAKALEPFLDAAKVERTEASIFTSDAALSEERDKKRGSDTSLEQWKSSIVHQLFEYAGKEEGGHPRHQQKVEAAGQLAHALVCCHDNQNLLVNAIAAAEFQRKIQMEGKESSLSPILNQLIQKVHERGAFYLNEEEKRLHAELSLQIEAMKLEKYVSDNIGGFKYLANTSYKNRVDSASTLYKGISRALSGEEGGLPSLAKYEDRIRIFINNNVDSSTVPILENMLSHIATITAEPKPVPEKEIEIIHIDSQKRSVKVTGRQVYEAIKNEYDVIEKWINEKKINSSELTTDSEKGPYLVMKVQMEALRKELIQLETAVVQKDRESFVSSMNKIEVRRKNINAIIYQNDSNHDVKDNIADLKSRLALPGDKDKKISLDKTYNINAIRGNEYRLKQQVSQALLQSKSTNTTGNLNLQNALNRIYDNPRLDENTKYIEMCMLIQQTYDKHRNAFKTKASLFFSPKNETTFDNDLKKILEDIKRGTIQPRAEMERREEHSNFSFGNRGNRPGN